MTQPQPNNRFWYGKRALVTGADGFVAANLVQRLMALGAVVTVVARHQRPITTLKLLDTADSPDIEYSDLSDFVQTQKICNRHQIDTIFHVAAAAVVSEAANAPISTCENNIIPTLNLLEAARINKIPRVLIASTDKSYGDHAAADDIEPIPYRENYALRGLDVYSASKVCADMISQTYAFQFKLPVLVLRPSNIYGPGDLNFSRLIPRTILRLLSGQRPVINQGNDHVLREYLYIDDMVGAYLFLAENMQRHYQAPMPQTGQAPYGWIAYNVGGTVGDAGFDPKQSPNIRNVVEVINLLRQKLGSNLEPVIIPKPANFIEIPDQFLDSGKLHRLGYQPKTQFDEGIAKTIAWYQQHRELLLKLGHRYVGT